MQFKANVCVCVCVCRGCLRSDIRFLVVLCSASSHHVQCNMQMLLISFVHYHAITAPCAPAHIAALALNYCALLSASGSNEMLFYCD